ncbi:hypothetical protein IKG33_00775 [Candidatus Saccharibacteria bacterium]|nr:hypothetical protein [Candidatus Saccharibacteria bacterium]
MAIEKAMTQSSVAIRSENGGVLLGLWKECSYMLAIYDIWLYGARKLGLRIRDSKIGTFFMCEGFAELKLMRIRDPEKARVLISNLSEEDLTNHIYEVEKEKKEGVYYKTIWERIRYYEGEVKHYQVVSSYISSYSARARRLKKKQEVTWYIRILLEDLKGEILSDVDLDNSEKEELSKAIEESLATLSDAE